MERSESADQIAEGGSVKSPAGPKLACSIPRREALWTDVYNSEHDATEALPRLGSYIQEC